MSKVPGWRVLCMAVVFLPAAFGVHASTPVIWKLAGHGDFIKGETRGVSITGKGRLTLSPVLDLVFESDEPLIWSLAADSRGNLYAGTGNDGKLYRIDPSGRSEVFFDADELEIRSVVIDRNDRVYAATFPDGRIYRIEPDGTHAVFFDPARDGGLNGPDGGSGGDPDAATGDGTGGGTGYIWSLALDAAGGLFAGTGEQGRVYRIDENGGAHLLAELEEAHVMALAVDGSGRLIAGTEPGGRVYRISSEGAISVLHDSPYGEVNTLLVAEDGAVFAGALSGPRRGARGGRAGTAGASMPPPPTGAPDDPGGGAMLNAVEVTAAAEGADRSSVRGFATGGSVVFRIDPDGRVDEWWRSGTDVGLSLAMRGENELLIGTGSSGRLYSVRERGDGTLLNELQESQITALAPDASDGVVVATSNRGNLYRLRSTPVREGEYESDVRDTRGMAPVGPYPVGERTAPWNVGPPVRAFRQYGFAGPDLERVDRSLYRSGRGSPDLPARPLPAVEGGPGHAERRNSFGLVRLGLVPDAEQSAQGACGHGVRAGRLPAGRRAGSGRAVRTDRSPPGHRRAGRRTG